MKIVWNSIAISLFILLWHFEKHKTQTFVARRLSTFNSLILFSWFGSLRKLDGLFEKRNWSAAKQVNMVGGDVVRVFSRPLPRRHITKKKKENRMRENPSSELVRTLVNSPFIFDPFCLTLYVYAKSTCLAIFWKRVYVYMPSHAPRILWSFVSTSFSNESHVLRITWIMSDRTNSDVH